MKKKMFFVSILLFLSMFIMLPKNAYAYDYVEDDCVNQGKCLLICNYNNVYRGYKSDWSRPISIYYYYSGSWMIKWKTTSSDAIIEKKGPDSLSNIFSNKGKNIYIQTELNNDNFSCPKYGYLDLSDLNSDNELCFDNNGKYCEKKSNIGTAFGEKANTFVSKERDYNYENDVKKYFNKWNIGDISCETLAENSDNSEKYFSNKFEKDFQTDYLKGNNVPSFMKNYLSNKPFLTTPIMKKIYDCGKYFHDQEKEGKITTEEMEEFLEKINSIDANEVVKALELKKAEMMTDDFDPDEYNKEQSCGTIFGDVKESGSFAWLIQKILNYIKIIGPTLVIILSSIDFIKVIWLSDEESMKKAQIKLAKRIVAAILLFLLPSLIGVLFNLINDSIEDPTCKIG